MSCFNGLMIFIYSSNFFSDINTISMCGGYTEIFIKLISVRDWIFWQELCKNRETKHCFSVWDWFIHFIYFSLLHCCYYYLSSLLLSYNKHITQDLIVLFQWSDDHHSKKGKESSRKFKKRKECDIMWSSISVRDWHNWARKFTHKLWLVHWFEWMCDNVVVVVSINKCVIIIALLLLLLLLWVSKQTNVLLLRYY